MYKSLCICEFGFQYIRCLVCRFAHYLSLAIFALKKPNTFCVLFCYYYLCVCVYLEDWLTVANYIY